MWTLLVVFSPICGAVRFTRPSPIDLVSIASIDSRQRSRPVSVKLAQLLLRAGGEGLLSRPAPNKTFFIQGEKQMFVEDLITLNEA